MTRETRDDEVWMADEVRLSRLLRAMCRTEGLDARFMDSEGVNRREEVQRRIQRVFPGLLTKLDVKPAEG